MANIFLNNIPRDIETALLLEQAIVTDEKKTAVAYTDGDHIFINTEENLQEILPAYDNNMLKWILWHEKMHLELKHHDRFYNYVDELRDDEIKEEFNLDTNDVNIIMDILVHDSMARMFPELVETALNNIAQFRNRNSLEYTFKTYTLEEMLTEYSKHKHPEDKDKDKSTDKSSDSSDDSKDSKDKKDKRSDSKKKGHGAEDKDGRSDKGGTEKAEDGAPDITDKPEPLPDEHHKTDWSKLEDRDKDEFIHAYEGQDIIEHVAKLKKKKLKLGKLTETLNSFVTTTRKRTYARPSSTYCGGGVLLKGTTPGRTALYLCFDASGSMGSEMQMFKEIISKSIPQAMTTPTAWFSGEFQTIKPDPEGRSDDYFKGTFKDFMPVEADRGYSDDGDRTIELCYKAEQLGYSPIGITDGGGKISWSKPLLKQLKKTILVGSNKYWLQDVKEINQKIQILDV